MELRLLEKEKKRLRLEVVNPDDTVLYPLVSRLLKDKRVQDARYITGHPHLDRPTLLVEVKQGQPQKVLKEVALQMSEEYGALREEVLALQEKGA